MIYKTNYELYVRSDNTETSNLPLPGVPDLINSASIFHRLPGKASIAGARHPQTSYSPRLQRSTRMSQPCSRSTTLIAVPSRATVTRAIGLRPIQHSRSSSRHSLHGEAVVRFHLFDFVGFIFHLLY
jgi:hypothetical protein